MDLSMSKKYNQRIDIKQKTVTGYQSRTSVRKSRAGNPVYRTRRLVVAR